VASVEIALATRTGVSTNRAGRLRAIGRVAIEFAPGKSPLWGG